MLAKRRSLKWIGLILADGLLVPLAFLAAYHLRLFPMFSHYKRLAPVGHFSWLIWIALPLWLVLFAYQFRDRSIRNLSPGDIAWRCTRAIFWGSIILSGSIFALKAKTFSRSLFLIFIGFNYLATLGFNLGVKLLFARDSGYSRTARRIVFSGVNERSLATAEKIMAHPDWNLQIVGFLQKPGEGVSSENVPAPVLGYFDDIVEISRSTVIDDVIFHPETHELAGLEASLQVCERLGIRTHLIADFFNLPVARINFGYLEEIPLITFSTVPAREWPLFAKQIMDYIGALAAIVIFSPVMAAIAVLIRLDSRGPVLFHQTRVGLNGRRFQLLKFRSMVKDAETMRREVDDLNEMDGPVFKAANDPRITRVGKWLRKTSLDELPQLFNVLSGHLSLVGPRPPIPEEVIEYQPWQRRRLSMKPGITCIWQVSGRSDVNFEEWMRMDLKYIDTWSLGLDIKILLKTIPAVLMGKGAR